MTNKSFFRLSLTSPPKIYTSPSFPAETFAACENRGKGFAFRNLRIDHGEGVGPDGPPLTPEIVLGELGGELMPFEAFTNAAVVVWRFGLDPLLAAAVAAANVAGEEEEETGRGMDWGGRSVEGVDDDDGGVSFLFLFRDQKDIFVNGYFLIRDKEMTDDAPLKVDLSTKRERGWGVKKRASKCSVMHHLAFSFFLLILLLLLSVL